MKLLNTVLVFTVIYVITFVQGCQPTDLHAEIAKLKQEKSDLLTKTQELEQNINTLTAEYDAKLSVSENARNELLTELTELNASFDSLNFYYADLSKATNSTDSLLTIINNAVLDKIQRIRNGQ